MQHLTDQELLELRNWLLNEQQDFENRARNNQSFGLSTSLRDNIGELSAYDNHPGDIATETYEREKDIALNENAEMHMEEIDKALSAINQGTYGICLTCKKPISFERLQAIPTTLYCKEHTLSRITSDRRPVEEQVTGISYGRVGLDESPELNAFDSEDTWQIVESWGTSNTPAMSDNREVTSYDEMSTEADENDGFVESFESFLATDMYGKQLTVIRNKKYYDYMHNGEGDPLLEPDQMEME
ncbi:molecular chaperone DnaK [Paenibacillus albiflavus]|uniref:Molecular chaperone DnaK n=1 Tax=Paenibacillus albiflavus TaxID=2545760 RepID=A0A4V2WMS0_9BACL|nr:TraR/DksA C4-type zinc finger protein [Paenibacillus albiflavus]TCZ72307.1 molecular chaperone DnaK [Paenibacillus albiflavus]